MIEVRSKPIRHGGKTIGIMGIARNITERKVAEQALKVSEINLSKLVEEKTGEFLAKNKEMSMGIKDLKLENFLLKKKFGNCKPL